MAEMGRPTGYTLELSDAICARLAVGESLPCIYGLYDRDGNLRYIGKAKCAKTRFAGHMAAANKTRKPLYAWIREHGRPEMRILESDCVDWEASERKLIKEARERGDILFNIADGGAAPSMPIEQRRKNGKANAAGRDPVIWANLMRLGQDIQFFTKAGNQRLVDKLRMCQDRLRKMGKSERARFSAEWLRRREIDGKFAGLVNG